MIDTTTRNIEAELDRFFAQAGEELLPTPLMGHQPARRFAEDAAIWAALKAFRTTTGHAILGPARDIWDAGLKALVAEVVDDLHFHPQDTSGVRGAVESHRRNVEIDNAEAGRESAAYLRALGY